MAMKIFDQNYLKKIPLWLVWLGLFCNVLLLMAGIFLLVGMFQTEASLYDIIEFVFSVAFFVFGSFAT